VASVVPPPRPVRHLPVLQTVSAAYGFVFGNLRWFLRAALVPYVMSTLLFALQIQFTAAENQGLSLFLVALGLLPYTLFAVSWHRLALLGPAAAVPPLVPPWRQRHWRFLGFFVLVTMIANFLVAPVVLLLSGLVLAGAEEVPSLALALLVLSLGAIVYYLTLRLSFVFPAISVDERYGLVESWRHTAGQGLRLLAAMTLAVLPIVLTIAVLFMVFAGAPPETPPGLPAEAPVPVPSLAAVVVFQVTTAVLGYVLTAVMVSVMSFAFRACTGWIPTPLPSPPVKTGG
jgi:hypothetical protein